MPDAPLRLAVIVGSTLEDRFAPTVARWFVAQAGLHPDLEIDLVDLADLDLPDCFPPGRSPAVQGYVERIDRADACVVVTPEYNHGCPAALKQAIDLANHEWRAKPVGLVSYGGMCGGLRAVAQLRQVFAELHAVTVRDTVSFHMGRSQFDAAGEPVDLTRPAQAATTMLDQVTWWGRALRAARDERPYAA